MKYLLDANIFLRHLVADDPKFSPRAGEVFVRLGEGEDEAWVSVLTLHEVLYVLEKLYKHERRDIVARVSGLLKIKNINILGLSKDHVFAALEIYTKRKIDWADLVLRYQAEELQVKVASFDQDFEKLGVKMAKL